MRVRALATSAALVAAVTVMPGHVAGATAKHPATPAAQHLSAPAARPAAVPSPTMHVTSIPRVGAIFPSALNLARALPIPHICSGSVVHHPSGDVVITAAHCVVGNGQGLAFAPGYHDGLFPYGLWTVQHVHVNTAWLRDRDPRHDYAFLTVAPKRVGSQVRTLESTVGSYPLATAPAAHSLVTIDGYLLGVRDEPLTCTEPVYYTMGYPSIDCAGFGDGTSGGPWLAGGKVVGVIGGLHQGGCTPETSYSAPFGADVLADLARTSTTHGDLITSRGSDGC